MGERSLRVNMVKAQIWTYTDTCVWHESGPAEELERTLDPHAILIYLFDLILYVPSFSYKGTGLPGLNQY